MNNVTKNDRRILIDFPLFSSTLRCHVVASSVVATLILAMVWVWNNGDRFYHDKNHSQEEIEAAYQLISEADSWRNRYSVANARHDDVESQCDEIRGWVASIG